MQGSCFICSDFLKFEHFTSKLESHPLHYVQMDGLNKAIFQYNHIKTNYMHLNTTCTELSLFKALHKLTFLQFETKMSFPLKP